MKKCWIFLRAILTPLGRLTRPPDAPRYLLIDALDESLRILREQAIEYARTGSDFGADRASRGIASDRVDQDEARVLPLPRHDRDRPHHARDRDPPRDGHHVRRAGLQ